MFSLQNLANSSPSIYHLNCSPLEDLMLNIPAQSIKRRIRIMMTQSISDLTHESS